MTTAGSPYVGKIVLYTNKRGQDRPAIVVVDRGNKVNLQVFSDGVNDGSFGATGTYWVDGVAYSSESKANTWRNLEK